MRTENSCEVYAVNPSVDIESIIRETLEKLYSGGIFAEMKDGKMVIHKGELEYAELVKHYNYLAELNGYRFFCFVDKPNLDYIITVSWARYSNDDIKQLRTRIETLMDVGFLLVEPFFRQHNLEIQRTGLQNGIIKYKEED